MTITRYLLTLPERLVRSTLGLAAGVTREVGDAALPGAVRESRLYQNVVAATLQFIIQQVGDVPGVYPEDDRLTNDFLIRRAAGNGLEAVGIIAFRASPVWVLAALADVCGAGRRLIPEIASALEAQGLLEPGSQFTTVDQLLDGLERTSARLASTINTPPLDVAALRQEWQAIRDEARTIPAAGLPSAETVTDLWAQLGRESANQGRSVFETSSVMAMSAVRALPDRLRWLSASAKVGAGRTGQMIATLWLDHYRLTLDEMQRTGFTTYAQRQLRPYAQAAVAQFSPGRRTLTGRLLDRFGRNRVP